MAKTPKLALIDANALIHRAYHALPPMSTKDGTPTNAAYGFTTMLLKMFSTLNPTHAAAAFDEKGPTFREETYKEYKANRPEAPDDLVEQFDIVRQIVGAFGIPALSQQGVEADDIIGTLTATIDSDIHKYIVTGDLDTLQLVDEHTSVFTLQKGITDTILYDPAFVQERYGFAPELIADYKGLRGDPSDNIPGVAGIGEKTAKELIARYGRIEDIYEHMDELSGRAKTKLEGRKEDALFSRDLATIKRDVELDFDLDSARLAGYETEAVREMFSELEFSSLMDRLPEGGSGVQPTLLQQDNADSEANPESENEVRVSLPDNYHLVETADDQRALRERLARADIVAFDTETDQLGARDWPIVGMSFAVRESGAIHAFYVPAEPHSLEPWKPFFEDETIQKTGHNLKYDIEVLMQSGIAPAGIAFDTMVASYILAPEGPSHSLDNLAASELGYHTIPLTDLIGKKGKDQKRISDVPLTELARYAAEDADVSLQLYELLEQRIREEGLTRVFFDIEVPLIPVLARMELAGVHVDGDTLNELNTEIEQRLEQLRADIHEHAGQEFNINSTPQLREILFEKLELPTEAIKRTQTGYSTAASELEKLRGLHPIIELLEEYRELAKLQNTYVAALPELVDEDTGRIYTSFNQTRTATGRLSSDSPNLQNIPARTDMGRQIRRAFTAGEGYVLIVADYSQLELRIAAHLSGDEKMLETFRDGEDIHTNTAAWIHGTDPSEVTPEQRRDAKTLNFGVLYGMGAQSFAATAGKSYEEAQSFIGRYEDQHPGLMQFREQMLRTAREIGYVETLFGRRRRVPELESSAPYIRAQGERMAFNFPIQGTEADIQKKAMIQLDEALLSEELDARMVLTVHDEIVIEAAQECAEDFTPRMKEIMETIITLDVPLDVDIGIGKNWQDAK